MLCYRCGSHVPETTDTCPTCGMKYDAAARQAAGVARKRGLEGAPYKPGDVIAGRYAVKEVVGSGPMGFVFRAQDEEIDVEVALKTVHPRLVQQPEERTQFAFSMRVGKKLNHPNLLRVYEEGLDGERPFFTMQLLEGMTLRRMMEQRAARGQLFSLKDVEPLLAQMAAALDAAHRFGPHSDLKPENVIVLPDLLKVTDYGLGLAVPQLPFVQAQKGHRADLYIAPEYVAGGELDTRMDVFSLGVIMGEMVTGLVPADGVVPGLTSLHPDLPTSFEALYRRALNINPLARPKTAGELATEFATILSRTPDAVATRVRSVPPPPGSAQAAAARLAARPPPPVPTDMLPVPTGMSKPLAPAAPKPAPAPQHHEDEPPPPDATQPLDAATLAAIMGSSKLGRQALTEQALPFVSTPAPKPQPAEPAARPHPQEAAPRPRVTGSMAAAQPRAASRPAPDPEVAGNGRALESSPSSSGPRSAPSSRSLESSPSSSGPRSAPSSRSQEPSGAGARGAARTLESAPAMSGPRPARTLDAPVVPAIREARTLESSPAVSGARGYDSPMTSGARSAPRIAPTVRSGRNGRSSRRRSLWMWMAVLVVGGLVLGAGGGYLALRYARARANTPVPLPVQPGGAPLVDDGPPIVAASGTCPAGMKLVSGGFFKMGVANDDEQFVAGDRPLASMQVESFCVDEYEYPNKRGESPKVSVTWENARDLCQEQQKRLCTEDEWEKACKGAGNSRFTYGAEYVPGRCNVKAGAQGAVAPSGRFSECVTPGYWVRDLSGNVAEWTATRATSGGYAQKGGAFNQPPESSRCGTRRLGPPEERSPAVGFRCCASVRP
ncbi:SUMF1/EgtB/PvdO family nonheme iron enzyme [Myxococcus sp. K15C18031901]|uniref:protein kinase domain-containing protein n=1 Tax=Myxococcus dinghuensis TaxID=2906761 RepID=UPI0020A7FB11|nr:SUMF1/EgtB/PvdO family nonheme iron enzyme [Myxococcus dinghuensis]MCP3097256.1 SUMF1/EgtB/PvdO family nonheme iron enzyme [Myxococcus dinghuensis]